MKATMSLHAAQQTNTPTPPNPRSNNEGNGPAESLKLDASGINPRNRVTKPQWTAKRTRGQFSFYTGSAVSQAGRQRPHTSKPSERSTQLANTLLQHSVTAGDAVNPTEKSEQLPAGVQTAAVDGTTDLLSHLHTNVACPQPLYRTSPTSSTDINMDDEIKSRLVLALCNASPDGGAAGVNGAASVPRSFAYVDLTVSSDESDRAIPDKANASKAVLFKASASKASVGKATAKKAGTEKLSADETSTVKANAECESSEDNIPLAVLRRNRLKKRRLVSDHDEQAEFAFVNRPTPRSKKPATMRTQPKNFDSSAFDAIIYAQSGIQPPPGVMVPRRAVESTAPAQDPRVFVSANPAVHGMVVRSSRWWKDKAREIRKRPNRKQWFGKTAERMRWLYRMKMEEKTKRHEHSRSSAARQTRQDPQYAAYRRIMDFGDVPEDQLPAEVLSDPAWVKACEWQRKMREADAVLQRQVEHSTQMTWKHYQDILEGTE